MMNTWVLSALWVGLALIATLIAIWFHMSTALSEIVVGTLAQLIIGAAFGRGGLLGNTEWITFLAGTGAIVLFQPLWPIHSFYRCTCFRRKTHMGAQYTGC